MVLSFSLTYLHHHLHLVSRLTLKSLSEIQVVSTVRNKCPKTPLAPYINGNGERMMRTGVDVIGLDRTVDMEDGRKRRETWTLLTYFHLFLQSLMKSKVQSQGLLVCYLWPKVILDEPPLLNYFRLSLRVQFMESCPEVVRCAGPRGHILNLVHGVLVVTPEEVVAHFFEVARSLEFSTPQRKSKNW
ncbi:hypothetical protein OIU76_025442 [Salix suchowensis]|nr:hypothetical protein OIU76_025442 [Salix suchowensis]